MQNPTNPTVPASPSLNVVNGGPGDRLFSAWSHLLEAAPLLRSQLPSAEDAVDVAIDKVRETLRKLVLAAPDNVDDRWKALQLAINVDGCGSALASHAARAFVDANFREVAEAAAEELADA